MHCPRCKSTQVQKRGYYKDGTITRVQCNHCRNKGKPSYFQVPTVTGPEEPDFLLSDSKLGRLANAKRFIITSAMNNTGAHRNFWRSVENFHKENGHRIVGIPVLYRNPKSPLEAEEIQRDLSWPSCIEPYLVENEVQVHPDLWIKADHKVQATAVNPLQGKEPLSCGASAIYGHAQIAMETVPTPQHRLPRILHTTGSISLDDNYSHSDRGKRAKFHHSLGAVIVEKEGPRVHIRVVVADQDGAFYDMGRRYHARGVSKPERYPALICGDFHARFHDPAVREATYDATESIAAIHRPRQRVLHDVLDAYAVNPHHRKDPIIQHAKHHSGMDDVLTELMDCLKLIDDTTPEGCENVIVSSNHNDFLTRWLRDTNPKYDHRNALIYHELMAAALRNTKVGPHGVLPVDAFASWADGRLDTPTRFLGRRDSFMVEGIELALHGDKGANGGRGSAVGLAKIGVKTVIGHSHGPRIRMGCYQVGASIVMPEEYVQGPTSSMHTHCLINPGGKRQLLHVIVDEDGGNFCGRR